MLYFGWSDEFQSNRENIGFVQNNDDNDGITKLQSCLAPITNIQILNINAYVKVDNDEINIPAIHFFFILFSD